MIYGGQNHNTGGAINAAGGVACTYVAAAERGDRPTRPAYARRPGLLPEQQVRRSRAGRQAASPHASTA